MKIRPVGTELFREDDMIKLIANFLNFANASNDYLSLESLASPPIV